MGEYVLKFMEFYGINGDWDRKSIYIADGSDVPRAREPGTLSFYSPQDDSHDIGKSAFKIRDIFNVFKNRSRVMCGKNF
jgi:DNA polymerase sigma